MHKGAFRPRTWALALTALILLGLVLRTTPTGPYVGMATLLMAFGAVVATVRRRDKVLGGFIAAAFLIRAALILLDLFAGVAPKADQIHYYDMAARLASSWWGGDSLDFASDSSVGAYVRAIAPLFFVFGPHPILPRLLSAILGAGATGLVFLIASKMYSPRAGVVAGALYALYPSVAQLQTETLRDPAIIFLILACVWLCMEGWPKPWRSRTTFVACAGFLAFLRASAAGLALLVVALLLIQAAKPWHVAMPRAQVSPGLRGPPNRPPLRLPATLAFSAAFAAVGAYAARRYLEIMQDPDRLNNLRTVWSRGGAAYLPDLRFGGLGDVLFFVPWGAIYFLFTPFPWQAHNTLSVLATLENIMLLYPLVALTLLGGRSTFADGRAVILLAFVVAGAGFYGLVEGNFGTALRHRAMVTWVFVVTASPTIARWTIAWNMPAALRRFARSRSFTP